MTHVTGFRELSHTADCAIQVWAPDLVQLLGQAARGLNAVAGVSMSPGPPAERLLALLGRDQEDLLVAFLSELVFFQEHQRIAFDRFELQIDESSLSGRIGGSPIQELTRPIKAITYHNLTIRKTATGLETEIVFDV